MPTRDQTRTAIGRAAVKAGGWGASKEDEPRCPKCNKRICGAKLAKTQMKKVLDQFPDRCAEPVCHRGAGYGTDHPGYGHCKSHYGGTPSSSRSAARQEARDLMRTYGVPVEIDPEDALREEIHRTVGHVRWLAEKVASIGTSELSEERPVGPGANPIDSRPTRHPNSRAREQEDEDEGESYTEDVSKDLVRLSPVGDEALVFGVIEREVQAGGESGGHDRVKLSAAPNVWLQVYLIERKHLADITKIAMAAGLESRRLDWAEGMADRLISAMEDLAIQLGHDPADPKIRLLTANALSQLTANAQAAM